MKLHKQKRNLILINMLLGLVVLATYAGGVMLFPEIAGKLWGDVPETLMPYYTVSMFLAASGYFFFTYFILVSLDSESASIGGRFSYRAFYWIYILILLPSALWLPLTIMMIQVPSLFLWIIIRIVLSMVAMGSLALLGALVTVKPRERKLAQILAVIGCIVFCNQTVVLDALIWPVYFPL